MGWCRFESMRGTKSAAASRPWLKSYAAFTSSDGGPNPIGKFAYRAYSPRGTLEEKVINGTTAISVQHDLSDRGYRVMSVRPARNGWRWVYREFPTFFKVGTSDLVQFSRQLATFIRVGVPIVDAIKLLQEASSSGAFRAALEDISEDLDAGEAFSTSIAHHPSVFNQLYIDMVRAAQYSIIERFTRTLSTMLRAGIPISSMFDVAIAASGNIKYKRGLESVKQRMVTGDGFSAPLEATGLFKPMMIRMIRVGEETGTLDSSLEQIADFLSEEMDYKVKNMISLMEPALVIAVGGAVGFVAVSVILPMYGLLKDYH